MTDFLGFAAFLILPLAGASILRSKTVREMNFAGQLAVAGAAGAAIVAAVMAILSVFRIDWSRGRLVTIIAVIAAISVYFARRFERRLKPALHPGIVFFVLLTTYGLLTARESCGDLHFFWGPKAVHFYRDGGVRTTFLADKNAERMGPGYPLMLPLLYSWSATMAKQFSWWAAVLATALFLFGSVALVHSATNDGDGAL